MSIVPLFPFEWEGFLYDFDFGKAVSQAYYRDISKGDHGLGKLGHEVGGISGVSGISRRCITTRIVAWLVYSKVPIGEDLLQSHLDHRCKACLELKSSAVESNMTVTFIVLSFYYG